MIHSYQVQENYKSCEKLRQIAVWHNTTPKLWVENYEITEEDVRETIERIATTPEEDLFLLIAVEGKRLLGFIWAYVNSHEKQSVMILSLYVDKDFRNQGLAKELKEALEEACKTRGIKSIQTTVHSTNHPMLELNKSLGYKSSMVYMEKTL